MDEVMKEPMEEYTWEPASLGPQQRPESYAKVENAEASFVPQVPRASTSVQVGESNMMPAGQSIGLNSEPLNNCLQQKDNMPSKVVSESSTKNGSGQRTDKMGQRPDAQSIVPAVEASIVFKLQTLDLNWASTPLSTHDQSEETTKRNSHVPESLGSKFLTNPRSFMRLGIGSWTEEQSRNGANYMAPNILAGISSLPPGLYSKFDKQW